MSWYPIASAGDLAYRTTYHAQILGHEFVAWRADDGTVNLWENRCLHRGVRLSRGINDGAELACQYHGWRYANQTAGCTYIPAHPADAPARTICNRTYPVGERYGLVWGSIDGDGSIPEIEWLDDQCTALRPLPVNATSAMVLESLARYRFRPSVAVANVDPTPDWRSFRSDAASWPVTELERGDDRVALRATSGDEQSTLVIWVQPVDAHRSVIRAVLDGPADTAILRHHNGRLSALRDQVEAAARLEPVPDPIDVPIVPAGLDLVATSAASTGRRAPLRVQVTNKWATAEDVVALELTSLDQQLPTFQPGAHIDVHLPNGLVRQYSLTNGPGELGAYRIGVKLEPESQGGSRSIHESVRAGDVLAISEPRNNFTLRRDSERTILLAGGIGMTPLLAMAQTLERGGLAYELHLFARSESMLAFPEVRARLEHAITEHLGASPAETGEAIRSILGKHSESAQVYVCGPGPMIEATIDIAAELSWPDAAVHFEYFGNSTEIDDSSTFEVALARSAITFTVASGQSVLEALRTHGVDLASSCEQGACGTCVAGVLEGEVLHQDVFLSRAERAAGTHMATCVSRASSGRLVLDL